MGVNSLHPGERAGLHHRVGHADGVQFVHYSLRSREKAVRKEKGSQKLLGSRNTLTSHHPYPTTSSRVFLRMLPHFLQRTGGPAGGRGLSEEETVLSRVSHIAVLHLGNASEAPLTVRMPCHSPASFLKSKTFTIVSPGKRKLCF